MPNTTITFAKIVATPTPTVWAHVYNAGNLFALLSLTTQEDDVTIASSGKEVINALEEEYFTLEKKTFSGMKQAVVQTVEKIPTTTTYCFMVAAILENVLYVFLQGHGSVRMLRNGRMETLLSSSDTTLHSISGYLEDNDTVILQTASFTSL